MRRLLLAGLLLAGAGLRARLLTANRFHPDEALYAQFGRLIATGRDTLLASVIVDKPPLPYYAVGGSMALFGPTEFAARLPSLLASVVSLALLYELGRRLYGRDVGLCALILFALSPFAISCGATVFVDPLQTSFLLWSAVAATRGQWGRAGLAAGLALACKQTTLAFVPPLAIVLVWASRQPSMCLLSLGRGLVRFAFPVALVAISITVWDMSRLPEIGFWAQGYRDNVATRFATWEELGGRLREIARLLSFVTATPVVFVAGAVGLGQLWWPNARQVSARRRVADMALVFFVVLYLAAYGVLVFNLWDRYFVVLAPLLCLLLARGALRLATLARWRTAAVAGVALAVALTPAAIRAANSGYPIGGDHGAYDGIDVAAGYLREIPKGAVLYDRWLSWELRYYLDTAPIYLVWMPNPETLTTDLRAFGRTSPRYFVTPSWEDDTEIQAAAQLAGFAFEPVLATTRRDGTTSFTVYEIVPVAR